MILSHIKILLIIALLFSLSKANSQNIESLKVALTHKIANCVVWPSDTSTSFTIGILSSNQELINKFNELTRIAKINNKNIRIEVFSDIDSVKHVHLLFIENVFNNSLSHVTQKIYQWNTLLVTEEYNKPGEIMVNLRFDSKTQKLSFEYNRANILFAYLKLTEQIVLLKGTEIEIRELYLQAKELWEQQRKKADSLEIQSLQLEKNLKIYFDSIALAKIRIADNDIIIQKQIRLIESKDSFSTKLNTEIQAQNTVIISNRNELAHYLAERNSYMIQASKYQSEVNQQKNLADSLSDNIKQKKIELDQRNKDLGEKETIINKQTYWLFSLVLIITVISILIFYILKSYITIKNANRKIAEQKEELVTILEKLQNTQEQLIQSEKMASLGILVAGIAHEINNPVNFISSGIAGIEKVFNKLVILLNELFKLKDDSETTEFKKLISLKNQLHINKYMESMPEIIENIKFGINRTISIIDGLRLYSRADKEEKTLTDINQIIESSLLLIKPRIKDQIEIITRYESLPEISVFPAKLSQVFVNILSNAIDAILENENSTEKGKIQIHSFTQNNQIVIEISDTGKGFSSEISNKIFDPFYTTKKVGKGTGLGLSISYSIIVEHHGNIIAKSNQDKGATFIVELPINT